jgi:DNA-binding MarR family transcriptional regulator
MTRVVHAYTLALQPVFLIAVPVAVVAFGLSWLLREVPLRAAAGARADIGEGLSAADPGRSSVAEVERALSKLACADIRRRGYERLASLAGLDLPAGSCWVLTRLARQGDTRGRELAGMSLEEGKPYVNRLVADGMVVRVPAPRAAANGDGVPPATLHLTPAGAEAAEKLVTARRDGLRELLADWSPEQHAELAELLNKLSCSLLGDDADRHLLSR